MSRFWVGTPPVLSYPPLEVSLDMFAQFSMPTVRRKSQALNDVFIALVDQECAEFDLAVISPRDVQRRHSQVSLRHPRAYQVVRALVKHRVQGDFWAPAVMRFGFTPPYLRVVDVWQTVAALRQVLRKKEWEDQPEALDTIVT